MAGLATAVGMPLGDQEPIGIGEEKPFSLSLIKRLAHCKFLEVAFHFPSLVFHLIFHRVWGQRTQPHQVNGGKVNRG